MLFTNELQGGGAGSTIEPNFVSPDDPRAHTQRIERCWRTLRSIVPKGTRDDMRQSYLAEYIWKMDIGWFKCTVGQRFIKIIEALSSISFD